MVMFNMTLQAVIDHTRHVLHTAMHACLPESDVHAHKHTHIFHVPCLGMHGRARSNRSYCHIQAMDAFLLPPTHEHTRMTCTHTRHAHAHLPSKQEPKTMRTQTCTSHVHLCIITVTGVHPSNFPESLCPSKQGPHTPEQDTPRMLDIVQCVLRHPQHSGISKRFAGSVKSTYHLSQTDARLADQFHPLHQQCS